MIRVVAGILRRNNTFLLARRASHKVHSGKWEFPGGKIENDELPEIALERELHEEFGIITRTGDHVLTTRFDYDRFQIELMAFKSDHITGSIELRDHDTIAWVSIEEMKSFDLTGADVAIWKWLESEL